MVRILSRTRAKLYPRQVVPSFLTPKSYPVLAGVNHLVPANCQVVPMSILTICFANPCQQLGKKVDLGRWPHIERNSPNWERCNFFSTMIETLSPQWDIGSDKSEALNLAKWGDFLLNEVLPDKMTCILTLISSVYAQIFMFLTLNKSDTLKTDKK